MTLQYCGCAKVVLLLKTYYQNMEICDNKGKNVNQSSKIICLQYVSTALPMIYCASIILYQELWYYLLEQTEVN